MIYRLKQLWCGWYGHPYPIVIVPIVWRYDENDVKFCTNCGQRRT